MLGLDPATDDMKPLFDKIKTFKPQMAAIVENDTQLIDLMNNGQATMSLAIVGDAPAITNAAWIVPTEGVSLSADGLYIPTGLPDEVTYYAELLINEMISPEGETAYCEAISAVPTNTKATPMASMRAIPRSRSPTRRSRSTPFRSAMRCRRRTKTRGSRPLRALYSSDAERAERGAAARVLNEFGDPAMLAEVFAEDAEWHEPGSGRSQGATGDVRRSSACSKPSSDVPMARSVWSRSSTSS